VVLGLIQFIMGWRNVFPELKGLFVCIDIETKDPRIRTNKSPGALFGQGFILGVGVSDDEGDYYFPIAHRHTSNYNLVDVLLWLQKETAGKWIVGANVLYDMLWLACSGVVLKPMEDLGYADVSVAAYLLNTSEPKLSLKALAYNYLGEDDAKGEAILLDWYQSTYGRPLPNGSKIQEHLEFMPPELVGEYCKRDTRTTLRLMHVLYDKLNEADLLQAFCRKSQVLYIVLKMMLRGVRFDEPLAAALNATYRDQEKSMALELGKAFNAPCEEKDLVELFSKNTNLLRSLMAGQGIDLPKTDSGQASLTRKSLEGCGSEIFNTFLEFRKLVKHRGSCIEKYLGNCHNGRIYYHISVTRQDYGAAGCGGTKTGRFSMYEENLAQVPSRDPEWGPLIRGLFLPEEGCHWGRADYSQQEPRIAVHYGMLTNIDPSAKRLYESFMSGEDFHSTTTLMAFSEVTEQTRQLGKLLGLGAFYGQGPKGIALALGCSLERAKLIYEQFHSKVPMFRKLSAKAKHLADTTGFIKTAGGRNIHFNSFIPKLYEPEGKKQTAKPYTEALMHYGMAIKRAFTKDAFNALIQGSGADMLDEAIIALDRAGFEISIPIYDELNFTSITSAQELRDIQEIMQSVKLISVPLIVEPSVGPTWGDQNKEINVYEF
jgi:DNA polymerase I-like protein with 3'-5' exonuclease and polymerase domains